MAEDKSYNGWSNYETWAMALWIDNDEGSYNCARELRDEVANDPSELQRIHLADRLKDWQEEEMEAWSGTLPCSVFDDLLGSAFGQIDWYEIAESFLSELAEA